MASSDRMVKLLTTWGLAALLSSSCNENESTKADQCQAVAQNAFRALRDAYSGPTQCEVDSDCVAFELPDGCWDSGSCISLARGTAEFEQTVRLAAARITDDICSDFEAIRCQVSSPGCPYLQPPADESFRCVESTCEPLSEKKH